MRTTSGELSSRIQPPGERLPRREKLQDRCHKRVRADGTLVHVGEWLVHAGESLVHTDESLVQPYGTLVHTGEWLVHAGETLVRSGDVVPPRGESAIPTSTGHLPARGGYPAEAGLSQ